MNKLIIQNTFCKQNKMPITVMSISSWLTIMKDQLVSYFLKNFLSQTFNPQYPTHKWSSTSMPFNVLLFVQDQSIINEYGRDSCSSKADWTNSLQSCWFAVFLNRMQGRYCAIQFSNLPQISLAQIYTLR